MAISLCGFVFGLAITWAFLYTFSHVHWPARPDRVVTGCHELGKCTTPWWTAPVMASYLCGPAIAYGVLNWVAWRRWAVEKWARWAVAIFAATAALYLIDYFAK
jgi:hypothetical protein